MRPLSEILRELADHAKNRHGEDSDWWLGYAAGLRWGATLAETHEAYVTDERLEMLKEKTVRA